MRRMVSLVISVCALIVFMLAESLPAAVRADAPSAPPGGPAARSRTAPPGAAELPRAMSELPPGAPEVVLEPHPGAGGVCAVVSVPVGSAFETSATRGISHLVEHMVFDGAERYSRIEMSSWVDDVGGFLNAFTRKETTVYFLLVPSRHAEKGIEILSQMLLHSIFLPAELDKERKVIVEEIRRETDDPQSARERMIERSLYRGSPLAEPIIGSPATIETMSREEVLRFYRARYGAPGMRIILMGDFDVAEANGWIRDYFVPAALGGGSPAGLRGGGPIPDATRGARTPTVPRSGERPPVHALSPRWGNEIASVVDAKLAPGFDMLIPIPSVDEKDFPAALLLTTLLGGAESPLPGAFKAAGLSEPDVSLEVHRDFSALRIHVDAPEGAKGPGGGMTFPGGDSPAGARTGSEAGMTFSGGGSAAGSVNAPYDGIPAILENLARWRPSEETVARSRVSFSSSEMFDREMYHLYVMSRGEGMGLFGERYVAARTRGIERVSAADCARVLRKTFERLRFNACFTTAEAAAPGAGSNGAPSIVEVFPNGITAGALARPGSPVAALHLVIKGRNCAEAGNGIEGNPPRGLAEALGTLFKGSRAGTELAKRLDAIGARVQFGDNPYVPFDDYLLSPSYSFVRLESPAASSDRAISLLVESLLARDFTADDLEAAKKTLAREVGMRSGSPMFALRGAIFRELFGVHPFGAPIFPSMPGLGSLTIEEVNGFAKRYLSGGNIVATFVSPEEPKQALGRLKDLLAAFPGGALEPCPPLSASARSGSIEMPTKKEGAYLAASWLVPASDLSASASILVAAEVLSRRMQLELREKLGLAYSTDCAVSLVPGGAVVYAYLGTGAARLGEAEGALETEIKGLIQRPPDEAEAAIARSRLIGRRTRSELASINGAYAFGLDLFLGGSASNVRSMDDLIASVPFDGVAKVIGSALSFERALLVKLVPAGASGEPQGDMPVRMPGRMPGQAPNTMPGRPPGKMPDKMPDKTPPVDKPPAMR